MARGLSWRQVAAIAGVSASTLSRMGNGKRPDVDSFAAMIGWLGVSADGFLRGIAAPGSKPLAELAADAARRADLSPTKVKALRQLLAAVERLME